MLPLRINLVSSVVAPEFEGFFSAEDRHQPPSMPSLPPPVLSF